MHLTFPVAMPLREIALKKMQPLFQLGREILGSSLPASQRSCSRHICAGRTAYAQINTSRCQGGQQPELLGNTRGGKLGSIIPPAPNRICCVSLISRASNIAGDEVATLGME